MGRIERLSNELVNKIAAGEVIERPASVLKELLENAIDAGTRTLTIELKNGGIDTIKVRDNGDGILSEDVELAVQRHTTSKLHSEKELYEISTLGFRGEALHSIGIVSELEITTRHKNEEIGTRINVKAGKVIDREIISHEAGTTVTVSNLFFNTPARKKFLGSPQAEYRASLDVIDRFVFGYKDIGIRLIHNSKEVFNIQPASLKDRLILRIDQRLKDKLYELYLDNGIIKIDGFISDPDYNTNSSRFFYIFVNGRYIIDKSINYTILNAYSTTLEKGRYPVAVINIAIPYNLVDVNISPTKTAAKFADKSLVYDTISKAIKDTINKRSIVYTPEEATLNKHLYLDEIKEATRTFITSHQPDFTPFTQKPFPQKNYNVTAQAPFSEITTSDKNIQQSLIQTGEFSSLNIHAQFAGTYIIATTENSIVLIDQHAMHERIIFEKLMRSIQTQKRSSQFLTVPEEIFLNENRLSVLIDLKDALDTLGYELTFKNKSVIVKAIPAGTVFKPLSLIEIIDNHSHLEELSHTELTADQKSDPLYRIMATIACKSAIKAGDFLSTDKIKIMFRQLDELGIPLNCPHGRPFVLTLSITELEKFFHRR
ncbi:MAG: DNA mismatch repair endonuclease MutL [bacterium]